MNYSLIYDIWTLGTLLEIEEWFRSSIMITMMIKINTDNKGWKLMLLSLRSNPQTQRCQDRWRWTLFYFSFFPFSIFRTARVRVDWSRCHISHKLMEKSQDWSRDLGELSRRFENRWRHTTWTPHVDLMNYT